MTTAVFDAHSHIFPPMATGGVFDADCLKETQYHVRFAGPGGFRRVHDNAPLVDPIMEGNGDGRTWLPDLDFRVGSRSRPRYSN